MAALTVTLMAAAGELVASHRGGSLFLAADAMHLLAHVGIFAVLLIPAGPRHGVSEDLTTLAVFILVALIAGNIIAISARELAAGLTKPPEPAIMLFSLLGLAANLITAYLFAKPARTRWCFRAALAHELSDGGLTVAGLAGALAIALFGWQWIDPGLSLAIGLWLAWWSLRLLVRRARQGPAVWTPD